jgi:UDP-N-acetylmuramate dehydrogenase
MNMATPPTELRGNLLLDEPMSKHTSWRIGGLADRYYQPADINDLALFLSQQAEDEPVYWLGLGSNLLVRDAGLRGTVIATSGMLNEIELLDETTVRAEVGVACAKVARFCARAGLSGAEFLAGIPGAIGGALAMNAGAFGGETWQVVKAVETISKTGQRQLRKPEAFEVAYRQVSGPKGEWFVAAHLQLSLGSDPGALQSRIKSLLAKRNESQPTSLPNAGSVFKNPEGDYAARLIEDCGMKGVCEGAACVSEKHANFIINAGGATARDVETLIERIVRVVKEKHGVELQTEVHIIGAAE